MRLIWTTDNADHFRVFCSYLETKGVTFTCDEQVVRDWGSDQYGTRKYQLWITEEDQVEKSVNSLIKFIDNPQSEEFTKPSITAPDVKKAISVTDYLEQRLKRPIVTNDIEVRKQFTGHIRLTAFVILICSLLFLYELYQEKRLGTVPKEVRQEFVGLTPVRKALLFDYPHSYDLIDKIITLYGVDALAKPQELPEAGKHLYAQFLKEPVFSGFYPYIVSFSEKELGKVPEKNPPLKEVTLFDKIRQGEIWRLFTPALLHVDLLHLFFNMIWVLLLSTQIEARLGSFRLLIFMLITGVISNVAQYLMSGPNFIGFSGIICAMATYIRARQYVAPWEAYQMSSSTFAFIMFFIGVLALFSLVIFFLEVFQDTTLPIGIANTAHLTGALTGYFLGRTRFFAWQLHS